MDQSHLSALYSRLARELGRVSEAKTEQERTLRRVYVAQTEKEIAAERVLLDLPEEKPVSEMSDDELLDAISNQFPE